MAKRSRTLRVCYCLEVECSIYRSGVSTFDEANTTISTASDACLSMNFSALILSFVYLVLSIYLSLEF